MNKRQRRVREKQRQTVRQRQTDRPALMPSGGEGAADSPELGTFPKALKLSCQLLRPWSPPGKTALRCGRKWMCKTHDFSQTGPDASDRPDVSTQRRALGGQLRLAFAG